MSDKKPDEKLEVHQAAIGQLSHVIEAGGRAELLKSVAEEIEKSMNQNLYNEFLQTNPEDTAGLKLCSIYGSVLQDFMAQVYARIGNGRAAVLEMDKLKAKVGDQFH